MKRTISAVLGAAVAFMAHAGAIDATSREQGEARAYSTADDIKKYESGGELAVDPTEAVVEAPQDMKLILCIGQSNMAGRAAMKDEDRVAVPNAYKLNRDGKWVAAKSPYHFDKTTAAVGPVDDFVKMYLADHPGESVGVVPCAVGGSGVGSWLPGGKKGPGKNFAKALERAKIASANGKFIAILWHQGETDAAKHDADALMKTYPVRVKAIADTLRKELGDDSIPFIVGEIGRWKRGDGDHAAKINPAIAKAAEIVPKAAVVSSEGLKKQDRHHFDRESQHILAQRYYEAFKSLQVANSNSH